MNKEKVRYVIERVLICLGLVSLIYLAYTGIRQVLHLGFYATDAEFSHTVPQFYLNSVLVRGNKHWGANISVKGKHFWLLILEIILVFIVPAILVIGAELKKHNEKVKSFFDKRKEKRLIKLQKQLNELKDKEL